MKFGRNYEISILNPENEQIIIKRPLSIKFTTVRNTLASANTCSLIIQNLGSVTRSKIFKDRYTIAEYWSLSISAGYNKLHEIFKGNILESYSYKQKTEWFTKIESFDGMFGIQNGFTNKTFTKETEKKNIIEQIIKDMPNIVKGIFGTPSEGTSQRGQVLLGQSSDIINGLTGGQYFIDNETLNILANNEYIGETVLNLDSSVLLSTPRRRETFLDCKVLFYPEAITGYLVQLNSKVKEYNGQYILVGFQHDFEYSTEKAGKAITKINLFSGTKALRKVS